MNTSPFTDIETLASLLLTIFAVDTIRYLIAASAIFGLTLYMRRSHANRHLHNKPIPKGQMQREFFNSIRTTAIFAVVALLTVMGRRAGIIVILEDFSDYGIAYMIGSTLLMIVAHDAWFYWTHRAIHHRSIYKLVHHTHHRSRRPTAWAAYSFSPVEAAINAIFTISFLSIVPMHGLGIFLFLTHMIFRNAMGHSGYELFPVAMPGHPVFGQITNVFHHDLHHRDMTDGNYGLYFTWWDRWMGTEHTEYTKQAACARSTRRSPKSALST